MPEHRERARLRETFGSVAEQYDRARPTYPAAVFDDLAELAQLAPGSRVLEIGPGTGKATAELVRRGYSVTGIELSPDLAAIARRNVPAAEIEVGDFETWEPQSAGFDAIVVFNAFHWIAPELRYAKPARLLRPGGALGVVGAPHVLLPEDDPFWVEVQEDYDAVVPHPDNGPPPAPDEGRAGQTTGGHQGSSSASRNAATSTPSPTPQTSTSSCSGRSPTTSHCRSSSAKSSFGESTHASPRSPAER